MRRSTEKLEIVTGSDLSQSQLSELTGISQSNISAYENDWKTLSVEHATLFAKVLKVHLSAILLSDLRNNQPK